MTKKRKIKIIVTTLMISLLFIVLLVSNNVSADIVNESESKMELKINGDLKLRVLMKNGEVIIYGVSHAATADIRWRTIGYTVTEEPIDTKEYFKTANKTYEGYGPVRDANGGSAELRFINAYERNSNRDDNGTPNDNSDDLIITTTRFSADQVNAELQGKLNNIQKGTPIYLHAIFQTYEENGDNDIIRKDNIVNWMDIMNAEWWSEKAYGDFAKYFNMKIEFMPAPPKHTLFYETESGDTGIKEQKELEEVIEYIDGEDYKLVKWYNEPVELPYHNKMYDLIGYYTRIGNNEKVTYYLEEGWSMDDITTGQELADTSGTQIHLVYKERTIEPSVTPIPPPPTPIPIPDDDNDPTPTTAPSPTPTIAPVIVPESETKTGIINTPEAVGVIKADNRGSEKFTVTAGIPTTESLYTEVKASQYLMGYTFKKQVGIETFPVTVTKNYILKWKGKDKNGEKDLEEVIPVTQVVSVRRAYGYWEIINYDYYRISNARVHNHALPGGMTTMYPNYSAGYSPPYVSYWHSNVKKDHLIIPKEIKDGIKLPDEIIVSDTKKPVIPKENFLNLVDGMIPKLQVKNDSLIINGVAIIDTTPKLLEGAKVNFTYLTQVQNTGKYKCNENILYQPNQIIEATKKNGNYNSWGMVNYERVASVNSIFGQIISKDIYNLGNVEIHTPVLCKALVSSDNDSYVQLLNPTNSIHLVLDPDSTLNDFTLSISNYGHHSNKTGYYTRDFSRSLRDPGQVSYLASSNGKLRNEVRFPFDIFIKNKSEDIFVEKNTWIVIDRNTVNFYVPMWVTEGVYTVSCRSVAVNTDLSNLDVISQYYANKDVFNYVATDSFEIEVSGRIYGLTIYDLTDYPLWEETFRVKDSLELKINQGNKYPDGTNKSSYSKGYCYYYTVGTNDQYGKDTKRDVKYTFPLVNGSHPYYKNIGILKTGYAVRFTLDTIGTMYSSINSIKIKPSFYYVDKQGKDRVPVDIYYEEKIDNKNQKLVRVGSPLDQINMKSMNVHSPYVGIPTNEINDTAKVLNKKYSDLFFSQGAIFNFSEIRIPSIFRTFINKEYTEMMKNNSQFSKIQAAGHSENNIMMQMQSWYGCYYLPSIVHAAPIGFDVYDYTYKYGINYNETFWKKDGYIIVNFDITTIDSDGKERLSYINASNYISNGNCSMWIKEGAPLSKKDYQNFDFNFKAGDFIIYHTNESVHDDYKTGGIY